VPLGGHMHRVHGPCVCKPQKGNLPLPTCPPTCICIQLSVRSFIHSFLKASQAPQQDQVSIWAWAKVRSDGKSWYALRMFR
jgi:hypothetical protein